MRVEKPAGWLLIAGKKRRSLHYVRDADSGRDDSVCSASMMLAEPIFSGFFTSLPPEPALSEAEGFRMTLH